MSTSEDDYEIRRTIWDSKIPVEFVLDNSQPMMRSQQSAFMMLHRVTYFPLHLDEPLRVLAGGNNVQEEDFADAWLLYDGEMIKWHYPIGVLYDLFVTSKGERTLPWFITVQLKNFPDELPRCLSKDVMKFMFIQSLKEASQIKHKRNIVSTMTKEEHARLFDSLCNGRFNDFWMVNQKFMNISSPEEGNDFVNIPIRFYQRSITFNFRQIIVPLQRKCANGESAETTLLDALTMTYPEFEHVQTNYELISHGINLPLSTSLGWMARSLSYPDNFVHVVLRLKDDEKI